MKITKIGGDELIQNFFTFNTLYHKVNNFRKSLKYRTKNGGSPKLKFNTLMSDERSENIIEVIPQIRFSKPVTIDDALEVYTRWMGEMSEYHLVEFHAFPGQNFKVKKEPFNQGLRIKMGLFGGGYISEKLYSMDFPDLDFCEGEIYQIIAYLSAENILKFFNQSKDLIQKLNESIKMRRDSEDYKMFYDKFCPRTLKVFVTIPSVNGGSYLASHAYPLDINPGGVLFLAEDSLEKQASLKTSIEQPSYETEKVLPRLREIIIE